ncbi:MAG TPA: hypothetical protein VFV03_02780 [Solirubrobacteraceae bacterium]|nr:hypothetical protein [Solirubrobacteraceae bacterium]
MREVELGECSLGLLAFGFECLDALAHEYGIDPGLDGGDLPFDALIEVGEGRGQSLALGRVLIHERRGEGGVLIAEPLDALRAEDIGRKELVDDGFEVVLAHVLPLAVAECFGGGVAVGDAVAAGVVGDALAFLAVHP